MTNGTFWGRLASLAAVKFFFYPGVRNIGDSPICQDSQLCGAVYRFLRLFFPEYQLQFPPQTVAADGIQIWDIILQQPRVLASNTEIQPLFVAYCPPDTRGIIYETLLV